MKKNLPYGCEAIAKRKCRPHGAGRVTSPIYKKVSLAGRLILKTYSGLKSPIETCYMKIL